VLAGQNQRLKDPLRPVVSWVFARFFERDRTQCVLGTLARAVHDVFFVQIGSNDGISCDPVHPYIVAYGWSGILVEPTGDAFEKLVANYRGQRGLVFESVAIADSDGQRDFWRLQRPPGGGALPGWSDQLGSLDKEVVLKHADKIPNIQELLVKESVTCVTFEALMQKHGVKKIDLLHVDAEGYDWAVISQVNFNQYRPAVIIFEHKHLEFSQRSMCERHLRSKGYSLFEEGDNTTAFLPGVVRRNE